MTQVRHIAEFESGAIPGQEEAYNEWYETFHAPEVLACPGFLSCERFVIYGGDRPIYVARYEIEGDDPEAVIAGMRQAFKERMTQTDTIDRSTVRLRILTRLPSKNT